MEIDIVFDLPTMLLRCAVQEKAKGRLWPKEDISPLRLTTSNNDPSIEDQTSILPIHMTL
jgi:hypothetical protein